MDAIITKFVPATSLRGARIKAQLGVSGPSVYVPYPYHLPEGEQAHWFAAKELLSRKLQHRARDQYVPAELGDGRYVFCSVVHFLRTPF